MTTPCPPQFFEIMSCNEIILEDIVQVEVYTSDQISIPVPPNVNCVSFLEKNKFLTPLLKLALSYNSEVEMSDPATLKITTARQAAGLIYTHDLSIPVVNDRSKVRPYVNRLQGRDFHVICQHADGSRTFSYGLHNTTTADIDETMANNHTTNFKLKLLSVSGIITLT